MLNGDRDLSAAGVNGVFDELLDDGGGSFDDLAGRDLRGKGGWQYLNVHGSS